MKGIFISVAFWLLYFGLNAQQITVVSSSDGEAVPYANILFLKNDSAVGGTYSNAAGAVVLNPSDRYDAIEISHVLYESVRIKLQDLRDTFILFENPHVLDEVSVFAIRDDNQPLAFLGNKHVRKERVFMPFHLSFEIVTLIENSFKEDKLIKNFLFITKRKRGRDVYSPIIKVVFYKNVEGTPSQKILIEKVYEIKPNDKGIVKVSLDGLNVTIPKEGIFVGIEWLGCVGQSQDTDDMDYHCKRKMGFNYSKKSKPTFARSLFKKYDFRSFNSEDGDFYGGKFLIPAFGIEVYE